MKFNAVTFIQATLNFLHATFHAAIYVVLNFFKVFFTS